MKLTQILFKQHLERMARKHWYLQGKKVVAFSKAEEHLNERGYEVVDGIETFVKRPFKKIEVNKDLLLYWKIPRDENHPDYKTTPCFTYGDNNVLLGGVQQVQVLTNTIVKPFPESLESTAADMKIPVSYHQQFQKKILLSCIFDAEQKKLPKKKDPARPAWNFPRDYGITDERKIDLLSQHVAALCEQYISSRELSYIRNAKFSFPIEAHGKLLQFEITAEALFTSRTQLAPNGPQKIEEPLPDIHPLHCTVSLGKEHFYEVTDIFPVSNNKSWPHIHTAIIHYDPTVVKNLYDCEVTADQKTARLMLKAFCMAACESRALHQGVAANPITVQVVQTDGKNFEFGVFQLNTLDIENNNECRNVFWLSPPVQLYSECSYVEGRPVLEGYNPTVLQKLMSFISNR